jgi:hypothetical protein
MKPLISRATHYNMLIVTAIWCGVCFVSTLTATAAEYSIEKRELPLLQQWSGDYPVSALENLPEGQRSSAVGYINDSETFAAVWGAFNPDEKPPSIDFSEQLVVFSRNITYYNRTLIVKVILEKGVAEIIAIETLTAMPIEDRAAMSIAVIPRKGVHFIQVGDEHVTVQDP